MPLKSVECLGGIIINGMPESLQNMKERITSFEKWAFFRKFLIQNGGFFENH